VPSDKSVAEIISRLPLPDHTAAAEKLEGFGDSIRASLATFTPGVKRA
jgi:hypothetical protein